MTSLHALTKNETEFQQAFLFQLSSFLFHVNSYIILSKNMFNRTSFFQPMAREVARMSARYQELGCIACWCKPRPST